MTTETLQLTFGITMDSLAFLAIFVYMPIANRRIRKKEQMDRIWRKIEHQLDFEPMYWWEKEDIENQAELKAKGWMENIDFD